MKLVKIKDASYDNTIKAFQPFYDEPLTEDDAIKIQNNLMGVLTILNKSKHK